MQYSMNLHTHAHNTCAYWKRNRLLQHFIRTNKTYERVTWLFFIFFNQDSILLLEEHWGTWLCRYRYFAPKSSHGKAQRKYIHQQCQLTSFESFWCNTVFFCSLKTVIQYFNQDIFCSSKQYKAKCTDHSTKKQTFHLLFLMKRVETSLSQRNSKDITFFVFL